MVTAAANAAAEAVGHRMRDDLNATRRDIHEMNNLVQRQRGDIDVLKKGLDEMKVAFERSEALVHRLEGEHKASHVQMSNMEQKSIDAGGPRAKGGKGALYKGLIPDKFDPPVGDVMAWRTWSFKTKVCMARTVGEGLRSVMTAAELLKARLPPRAPPGWA